jgi:hypothetical protein
MNKKYFNFLGAAAMAFGVVACENEEPDTETVVVEADEGVTAEDAVDE